VQSEKHRLTVWNISHCIFLTEKCCILTTILVELLWHQIMLRCSTLDRTACNWVHNQEVNVTSVVNLLETVED